MTVDRGWHDPSSFREGEPPIKARTTVRHRIRSIAFVELILLSVLLAPSALAETVASTLSVSASLVSFGQEVTVTGSVSNDAGCTAGRVVLLEWRPADSAGFATVATGTTKADGSFSFAWSQPNTGRYRAVLPEDGGCLASTTNESLVRVRARVDAALVAGPTEAGTCLEVAASVQPGKPGQTVELLRRTKDSWSVIERLTLDDASEASARPCLSFDDIGVARLRARWIEQDRLNETSTSLTVGFEVTEAPWMRAIDEAIDGRRVSVVVGDAGDVLYRHAGRKRRIPASNEKLLLSMAMYDTLGPGFRIRTSAAVPTVNEAGVAGDLWILGRGDPLVDRGTLASLVRRVVNAGVTRVRGRVFGSTAYFRRDWNAPGWNDVARDYVNRPTALVFERNAGADPELHAAQFVTNRLEALGVRVAGKPGTGAPPTGLDTIAFITSPRLQYLLSKTMRPSDNFLAEVLGKRLGAEVRGVPGTIAKGAASIQAWTDARGTTFTLNDNSGLSYANRVTSEGIVRLLWAAEGEPWGDDLRRALPTGGQGTLVHRLRGVEVRAKTGTLDGVSALSGWVHARHRDTWVAFSILSSGLSKSTASAIEDRVVVVLQNRLH